MVPRSLFKIGRARRLAWPSQLGPNWQEKVNLAVFLLSIQFRKAVVPNLSSLAAWCVCVCGGM